MYNFLYLFSIFIIISFLGWICEIIFVYNISKKIQKRGFLIGPYCPIYGAVSVFMILTLYNYQNNLILLFILSSIICTIAEYITSYAMEKIFNARWWDYSDMKFNLNGRICLSNSFLFGIGTILLFKIIFPILISTIHKIPNNIFIFIFSILLFTFILDIYISFRIIIKLKIKHKNVKKDNTSEINILVRKIINKNISQINTNLQTFYNQIISK